MRITAKEFKKRTKIDPNWCSKITEPTEVIDYAVLSYSKIESLSPLLTFHGNNGDATLLDGCKNLKVAEGTFHGCVDFSNSGIQKIGNLVIKHPNLNHIAARFSDCKSLKLATGTYPGVVTFENSGVEEIRDLHITQVNRSGTAASFHECYSLKIAEGDFPGFVNFARSGIIRSQNLLIRNPGITGRATSFENCPNLKIIRGEFNGEILAEENLILEYRRHQAIEKITRAKKEEITLEL